MIQKLIILLIVLFGPSLKADMLASKLLYFREQGKTCGDVTASDFYEVYPEARNYEKEVCVKKDGTLKSQLNQIQENLIYPPDEIGKRIFDEAARIQKKRDDCVIEWFEQLEKNQDIFRDWMNAAVRAWLSKRKSSSIRDKCNRIFFTPLEDANVGRYGEKKAWERRFEKVLGGEPAWKKNGFFQSLKEKKFWEDLCFDPKIRHSLAVSDILYDRSVPLVSTEKVFAVFDQFSQGFKIGNPPRELRDGDLMTMNLPDDINKLNVQLPDGFFGKLKEELSNAKKTTTDRRNRFASKEASLQPGEFISLSKKDKNYLHQEGLLVDQLKERGYLQTDIFGGATSLSAAAVCLLSDFQDSLQGNVMEIVAGGVFGGGLSLLGKASLGAKGSLLAKAQKIGKSALVGAFGPSLVKSIVDSCFQSHEDALTGVKTRQSPHEMMARHHLPPGVEKGRFTIPQSLERSKSCDKDIYSYLHRENQINNCVFEVVLSLGPEKLVLPLELMTQ